MCNPSKAGLALAFGLILTKLTLAAPPLDYSKEAVVVRKFETKVSFAADGSRDWRQTLSVRIQSEAALRQFGVLTFSYTADNEQITVEYVRVTKPDGAVVETPASSLMDVAANVPSVAPTYIDIRQKQMPVKALGVGDVLEYAVHNVQRKPEIPGHFWYTQYFADDLVVLAETLEVKVPKEKYVKVASPGLTPESHEDGDQRVYIWTHSHLALSAPEDKKKPDVEKDPPKVELTSFRSWDEVGAWWSELAVPQAVVTPAIEKKAKELTAGLTSSASKEQAIYQFVAMKFRYVSISLGLGKYRPHSAEEVLANQYGDCKDKHTLFAALLKAVGVEAWPALIGAGLKFDASLPSPAQFNHVITVLPQDGKYVWLDTTTEVAPFGLLSQGIRDEQALVIPTSGGAKAMLAKTPLDPPFPSLDTVTVKASLTADGTLTGHFDFAFIGDGALGLRAAFRQLAPVQWQASAQQFSYAIGFSGDVSAVSVENVEQIEKPFQIGYDYTRKEYSDWKELKITPPVPPLGFDPGPEADKPKDAFWAGAPGVRVYKASVQLPKGFTIELPPNSTVTNEFADYASQYSFKDGTLTAERKVTIKKAKVAPEQWTAYQKFSKELQADQNQYFVLTDTSSTAKKDPKEAEIAKLMYQASQLAQARNVDGANDVLDQVEALDPKAPGLWASYGALSMMAGQLSLALEHTRREIRNHPDSIAAYNQLAFYLLRANRISDAIDAWEEGLAASPDANVARTLVALLLNEKRYEEIPGVLEKSIAAAPEDYVLQAQRAGALLHIDLLQHDEQKKRGVSEVIRISHATSKPDVLNLLAIHLAQTGTELALAQELIQKALAQTEEASAKESLASLTNEDFSRVNQLADEWETRGWVFLKQNELVQAKKYFGAAWQLSQSARSAEQLGLMLDQEGKHKEAIHMWQLAAAANPFYKDVRVRLGMPSFDPRPTLKLNPDDRSFAAEDELGKLRTFPIPALPVHTGAADFYLLISKERIDDAKFISGDDALKDAGSAIRNTKYPFPFPDVGGEKIVRRAVLSCSQYTKPSCGATLILPSDAWVAQMPSPQTPAATKTPF